MRAAPRRATVLWTVSTVVLLSLPLPARAQGVTVTGRLTLDAPEPTFEIDYSDALVWLTPLDGASSGDRATPARFEIVQENKQFTPRVLPVPAGSTVDFPNLDPFFHNVFSLFEGKRFDLGLYEAGTSRSLVFDRPGISYVFCNIHPEMVAVIVAIETEWFGWTDENGVFGIEGVPRGEYQLRIWHERMRINNQQGTHAVTVSSRTAELPAIPVIGTLDGLEGHANKFGLEYEARPAVGAPYRIPR